MAAVCWYWRRRLSTTDQTERTMIVRHMRTRRIGVVAAGLALIAGACGGGDASDAGNQLETTTTATRTPGDSTPAPTGDTPPTDTTTSSPTEETAAALEWLAVGELPVEANVLAGATVTRIGSMWSVRTSDDFEFRVTPPPDEAAAGINTLENELALAEGGIQGELQEVLLNEPGEAEWFLGYSRDDLLYPGESQWVLRSLRSIGGVEYNCSSISGGAEAYEWALQACRTLRAAG